MKKTGLYFGSFNPIHTGHMIVAEYFATQRDFDEVWMIVSPRNPLKSDDELAPANSRLDMVKMAMENNAAIRVSDIEFYLDQPSFTIHTLRHISREFPEDSFTLLLGEDSLSGFHKWKNYEEILANWPVEIFPRHTQKNDGIEILLKTGKITIVSAPRIEISSTLIRNLIREEKSIRYLVPDNVASYIQDHGLYR